MGILHTLITFAASQSPISPGELPTPPADRAHLQTILAIVFGIIGAAAVLVITISGFRYVVSAGDPQRMSKARNGIIFALIGLLVAITAEAIVAFVVGRL